ARHLVEGGHLRLSRSSDINKDRNENQQRVTKKAKKAKPKCQDLPQGGRELRRSGVAEFQCEEGMENAAAVHRKSRDHIEKNQEDVDGREPCKKREVRIIDMCQGARLNRAKDQEDEKSDDDVYHRSCDSDRKFLHRFLWHSRHACHASDGQQNYIRCLDPEAPRHEDMAEFMKNDATKNENNEEHTVTRRRNPSLLPGTDADPGKKEKEGKMHPHGRCAKSADRQRPRHEVLQLDFLWETMPEGADRDRVRCHEGEQKSDQDQTRSILIYIYHPLMQMSGLRRATIRARPACSAAATTAETSL